MSELSSVDVWAAATRARARVCVCVCVSGCGCGRVWVGAGGRCGCTCKCARVAGWGAALSPSRWLGYSTQDIWARVGAIALLHVEGRGRKRMVRVRQRCE
jgi:hypothetical protein